MIKSKYYYQQTHSSNENILNKKNDSIYTNYLTTYKKDYKTIKINHSLTNKYKNMFEEIKKKLGEIAKNRLEIVEKPETKAKPELIKKYKDIFNENLLNLN